MNDRHAWRIAVRESGLDATAKLVAFTLDTYMDKRGIAWPARPSLAASSTLGIRTVDRALLRLERAGFIVVARGRGRRSNLYCADVPSSATGDTTTGEPTVSETTLMVPLTTANSVSSDTRSRKEVVSRRSTADRSREQDHIDFNTDVDPAVLDLAYGWIASHRMPK